MLQCKTRPERRLRMVLSDFFKHGFIGSAGQYIKDAVEMRL